MKLFIALFISLVVAFRLLAESQPQTQQTPPPPLDPTSRDQCVKPQEGFFMYATGGWIKRTEIPPEYSRWGSFNQLIEHNNDALHAIAEKAAKAKSNEADAK